MNALAASPGKYTIPPFEVSAGNKSARTAPLTFTVRDASQLPAVDGKNPGQVQMQLRLTPDRQLYVGETAELTLSLLIPENVRLNSILSLKESGFGDALFIRQGRNKAKFSQSSTRQSVFNGVRYTIHELAAYFQPQRSGEYTPRCEAVLQVMLPGRDDFFGGGFFSFGSAREIAVRAAGKTLSVRPLPPVPSGMVDTGLVGKWLFEMSVPLQAEFKTGEVAEITLNISGNAPAELFRAPEISIPQSRIYPPEVKRTATGFIVKYLFVPLAPGARKIRQVLAFFDPEKERYESSVCEVEFLVTPGSGAVSTPQNPVVPQQKDAVSPETSAAPQIREYPVYPLEPGSYAVTLPLWENQRGWIIFFLTAGAGMMLASVLISLRKKSTSPQMPKDVRRALRRLAAEISSSGSAADVLQKHGLAEIAAAAGLPPGATAGEIAAAFPDAEVKDFFRSLNDSAFLPGEKTAETPELRKKLAAALKKLTLVLIIFATMPLQADFRRGCAAFDAEKYEAAKEFFRQMLNPTAPNPYNIYNTGCPAYMMGNFPEAALAFERAMLLRPGDSRIRSAYHNTIGKLPGAGRPDDGSFTGFITALRDRMRPDQYLLLGSFCFFVLGIFSLCGGFPGKRSAAALLATVTVLAVIAAWSQSRTVYSPFRARIISARAQLHRLPAASGSVAAIIPGGSEVKILKQSGDWVQIRLADNSGGWVKRSEVQEIMPHGIW